MVLTTAAGNLQPRHFSAHLNYMDDLLRSETFQRDDDSDDSIFYSTDRFVQHLDDRALATVTDLIGRLVPRDFPAILDLMASHDSHLPPNLVPLQVTGLGLNPRELAANETLTERVVHDLNRNPGLPLDDETYDAALCTVSVDYLTKPVEVFRPHTLSCRRHRARRTPELPIPSISAFSTLSADNS